MTVPDVLSRAQLQRVSDGQVSAALPPIGEKPLLLLVWPQLGDFDSMEYAWWLRKERPRLAEYDLEIRAVGIGDRAAGQRFCQFTGFAAADLFVDPSAALHRELGLYPGLGVELPAASPATNAYVNLLLMCAGIGSPGTLREVLRGYVGDRKAPQLIEDDEVVQAAPLPAIRGSFFRFAGGKGFQRPFELATLRLRNMAEVLGNWSTYVPDATYLTQRGATFLFDRDGELLYEHRDRNLLGFSSDMHRPLSFLSDRLERPQPDSPSPTAGTVTPI